VGELVSFGMALPLDRPAADAHYRLGRAFARRGAWGNAKRELDRAIALEPDHALAHFQRGLIHSRVWPDFEKAAADLDRALGSEPHWHDVRLHRAHCLAKLGRFSEAADDAEAVLAIEPWNLDAHVIRGRARQRSGQHREALADFDESATLYPFYLPLYELRSASLKALGDEQGAALVNARCAQLIAGYPEHGNGQAWRLVAGPAFERDPEGAYALARRAVEAFPRLAHLHNTLGVALYRLGRQREAQHQLRESLRLGAPKDAAFDRYFLAMCHRRLGEPVLAWAEFLRAVGSHGRNESRLTPIERTELAGFFGEALTELVGVR
jgi:tetratricopeptide (TPR) repeat protein